MAKFDFSYEHQKIYIIFITATDTKYLENEEEYKIAGQLQNHFSKKNRTFRNDEINLRFERNKNKQMK